MSNRTISTSVAADQRVYVTNSRLPVFDANSEQIKLDISNNVVPVLNQIYTELQNLYVSLTGPSVFSISGGITGSVELTKGVTGDVRVLNGLTGSFDVTSLPAITGSVSLSSGITGDVRVLNGLTGTFGLTGPALDTLIQIDTDVSAGILVKGTDDTGARNNFYVDENGLQRTIIFEQQRETAKYIFETDLNTVCPSSPSEWILDVRGREGWYFENPTLTTGDLEWYSNLLSNPPSLNFNKMQALWFICTVDNTASPSFTMTVTTSASTWQYAPPNSINYYNGETYLFYYGNKAITQHPEIHALPLTRTLTSGPGANSELIFQITFSTGLSTGVLLDRCGIWNQDLQQQFEVLFRDVRAQTAEDNLISLDFSGTSLKTAVTNKLDIRNIFGSPAGNTGLEYRAAVNQVYSSLSPQVEYGLNTRASIFGSLYDGVTGYSPAQSAVISVSQTNPLPVARYSLSTTVDNSGGLTVNLSSGTIVGVTGLYNGLVGVTGSFSTTIAPGTQVSITGPVEIQSGFTGTVTVSNFPVLQGVTGNIGILPNQFLSLTGETSKVQITNGAGNSVAVSSYFGTTDNQGTQKALFANSALYANNLTTGQTDYLTLTGVTGAGAYKALDVAIKASSIIGVTGPYGSNTVTSAPLYYPIPPKTKSFQMHAFSDNTASANALMSGIGSAVVVGTFQFGLNNPRQWYFYIPTGSTARSVKYHAVDGSGAEVTGSVAIAANSYVAATQSNLISINRFDISGSNVSFGASDNIFITTQNTLSSNYFGNIGNTNFSGVGLYTCPNNCIASVTSFDSLCGTANEFIYMDIWDVSGTRSVVSTIQCLTGNFINYRAANESSGIGRVLTAGETLAFHKVGQTARNVNGYVTILQKYL